MLINDRKSKYSEFVEWVTEEWDYHIPGTIFEKKLTGQKSSFKSFALEGLKHEGKLDELLEQNDFEQIFEHFVAFAINDNSKDGYRKFLVNDEYISNIWWHHDVRKKALNVKLFLKPSSKYAMAKARIDKVESLIIDFNNEELSEWGFGSKFCGQINELRTSEEALDYKVNIETFRLSPKDHAVKSNDDFPNFSLPDFFVKLKFQSNPHINDNDNTFNVAMPKAHAKFIQVESTKNPGEMIFIAPIKIDELVNFVNNVKNRHGSVDSLFSLNVRDRKSGNKVSKSIINTVLEQPENFLMLNNGITAIVDKVSYKTEDEKTQLSLENIRIINGQQTTFTLFSEWEEHQSVDLNAAYAKASVLLKVYSVNNNERDRSKFFNMISNASNSQTAIKSKDLMSTRTFNKSLREDLLNIGINYEFRDGKSDFGTQFKDLPKTNLNKLVKMHYIVLTNEVWKRGSIGQVFDALTGMSKPQKNNQLLKYAQSFSEATDEELSSQLSSIARKQLLFEARKEELGKELQALDLLVYLSVVLEEETGAGEVDINEFVNICSSVAGSADRNNFYKSKETTAKLCVRLFENYGLQNSERYQFFKEQLKK